MATWRDVGEHPNGVRPLKYRHRQLTRAAGTFKGGRIRVIRQQVRGKKVLDLGCVAHNFEFHQARGTSAWLHHHVVQAAGSCVGADYDLVGVKLMREAGYDVVHVDITGDLTPIVERGPFEVVVAGELIEHLPAPQQLLSAAYEVLQPGGKLIITSPNPYSPRRVRAGQRGLTWENVDHVLYVFPSGMAEMADRTGFRLTKYGTAGWPGAKPFYRELAESLRMLARACAARARGKRHALSTGRWQLPLPTFWQSPLDILSIAVRGRQMARETAIYILTKPRKPAQGGTPQA